MKAFRIVPGIALVLMMLALFGCGDETTSVSDDRFSSRSDSSFAVGDSSILEVENFAGNVDVVTSNSGAMQVSVVKWATDRDNLDPIDVQMAEFEGGVRVAASNPEELSNVSVDIAVTVPDDTRTTCGVAAGNVTYEGRGAEECSLSVAAGTISIFLPADANVDVSLSVAAGDIRVDFPVTGQVSTHSVNGIIGSGDEGRIVAMVAAGEINIIRE